LDRHGAVRVPDQLARAGVDAVLGDADGSGGAGHGRLSPAPLGGRIPSRSPCRAYDSIYTPVGPVKGVGRRGVRPPSAQGPNRKYPTAYPAGTSHATRTVSIACVAGLNRSP